MHLYTVALLAVTIAQPQINPFLLRSWAFGKKFELDLSKVAIEKSPRWNEIGDPPLSLPKALQAAKEVATKMEDASKGWSDVWKRHTRQITLYSLRDGHWLWIITFEWLPKNEDYSGSMPTICVAVMMDGKAIAPVPSKDQGLRPPGT